MICVSSSSSIVCNCTLSDIFLLTKFYYKCNDNCHDDNFINDSIKINHLQIVDTACKPKVSNLVRASKKNSLRSSKIQLRHTF